MNNTIALPRSVVEQALEALNSARCYRSLNLHKQAVQEFNAAASALRAALEQPQDHTEQNLNMVPAGWKLVPVDPTDEMREAGKDAHYEAETRTSDADAWSLTGFAHRVVRASYIYHAMLDAAPHPPVVEQPQGEQEPVAWMFQHDETGRIMYVDAQQVEWGFEKGNPRWQKIYPVYLNPQPKREPLTEERIDALRLATGYAADLQRFTNIVRTLERAHGIGCEA